MNPIIITFAGRTQTLNKWARELEVRPGTLYERMRTMPQQAALSVKGLLITSGRRNGMARLNAKRVDNIRLMKRRGFATRVIAQKHHVPTQVVSAIVRRKSWAHIP